MPLTPLRFASRFALRFIWRDLRGGLRGFGVFIACIALGVMAIAGVGSVAASLNDGIGGAGRVDPRRRSRLCAHPARRQATPSARFSTPMARSRSPPRLRAMARTTTTLAADGRSTLVEVKAVDANYPLFGTVVTDPAMPLAALFAQNGGAFGAAVDPTLLTRLDLKTGDRITHRQCRDRVARGADRTSRTSSPAASASARAC